MGVLVHFAGWVWTFLQSYSSSSSGKKISLCCAGNDDDSEWLLPCRRMQEICIGLILQSKSDKIPANIQLVKLMC